jgi:putative two-component system response regulator
MDDSKRMQAIDKFLEKIGAQAGSDDDRPLVIVVDDIHANIFLIESILSDKFRVMPAPDAAELWKILQKKTPALILLDLMMPQENGFEVLEKMKSDPVMKQIPVIVVTAKDTREDVLKAMKLGAVDFITKPVKDDILLAKVAKALKI